VSRELKAFKVLLAQLLALKAPKELKEFKVSRVL
jgi:hypothetical protein